VLPHYRLAILASGSGSNAEAICRYFQNHPSIRVALILSNNATAGVLQYANTYSITAYTFTKEEIAANGKVVDWLKEHQITHLVLAGFLWLVPQHLVQQYPGKIINIHPALLPKFGGKGMYGIRVHEAVKQAGETQTGLTIHEVNERYDEGVYLFQARCPISAADTASTIAARVLALEHQHYPSIIEQWVLGKVHPLVR
jgi:phosphoribosylglycinamide formyltransferase 1